MIRRTAGALIVIGAVAVAAGAGSGTAAPTVERAAAVRLHVRIAIPRPGDIVLARIVVRARPGIGVPVRLRLKALNADKLRPSIVAVGGVVSLHRRPLKYVSVVAIINKRVALRKPRTPWDRFVDIDLVNAVGATPADARQYFRGHVRVARDIITHFGEPGQQALLDLFQPVEGDTLTPMQQALADRGLDSIALAGLPARTTSALRETAPPKAILADSADAAKSACSNDADHTEKAVKHVEGDVASTLNPVNANNPTTAKRCDLTRFLFKGLRLSFSAPNPSGALGAFALSNITGSVCGDPLKTAWNVTFASTGEGTRTAQPKFSSANPFTIATRSFGSGSTLAARLQYDTTATPVMKVSGTPKGKVTKVVASPTQVAVTSTAVQAC